MNHVSVHVTLQGLRSRVTFPIPMDRYRHQLAAIKEANKAVKSVTSEGKSKRRGSYAKFSPEQQAGNLSPSLPLRKIPSSIEPGCDLLVCTWNIGKWVRPNQLAIERTRMRVQ